MKKFLFLFAALILSVASAWALDITDLSQVEADAYYTIHCGRGNLAASEDLTKIIGNQDKETPSNQVAFDAEETRFQFQFKEIDGAYYLYNVAAEKYVNNVGNFVETATEAGAIQFRVWDGEGAGTVQPYWDDTHNLNLGGDYQVAITKWMKMDDGDKFQITKLEIEEFTLSIVGGGEEATVLYKGAEYGDGEKITMARANIINLFPATVEGYDYNVSVEGTTITVTYTEWPEWTLVVTGLPEEDMNGVGCFIKGSICYVGGKFRASSIADTDVTEPAVVDGYRCNVSIDAEAHTVTLVYSAIRTIDTTKAYYIKNVDSQKYVVIPAPGAGNATISSSEKSKVTFEQVEEGVFTIKGNNGYLGASGWDAIGQADAFNWTVAEYGDDAWTFNQQTATYKGFLGLDHDGNGVIKEKLYCNKGASNHYAFVLEEAVAEVYTIAIEGLDGAKVTYKGGEYGNGDQISADEVSVADFTANVENYMTTVTVVDKTVNVHFDYARKVTLDQIETGKAYMFVCERGQLIVEDVVKEEGAEAAPMFKKAAEVSYCAEKTDRQFGLIKKGGNYYLWSVGSEGFVFNDKSVAAQEDAWAINFNEQEDGTVQFTLGGKVLNMQKEITSYYGLIIDGWTTADGGNKFAIYEVGDFDATAALALLREPGDIDGDGSVDVEDVKNFVDELIAGTATEAKYDVNGDGHISVADITKLIELLQPKK